MIIGVKTSIRYAVATICTLGIVFSLFAVVWGASSWRRDQAIRSQAAELIKSATLSPKFASVVRDIRSGKPMLGTDGKTISADTVAGVDEETGALLYSLCRQLRPRKSIEIGFAHGFSTAYILAALDQNGSGTHTAVDPFELTDWHGVGLRLVQELGQTNRFRFLNQYSHDALYDLRRAGEQFDLIFIDGDHRFDYALLDFMLADRICNRGGVIVVHDTTDHASLRRLHSWIVNDRSGDYKLEYFGRNVSAFRKVSDDPRLWSHYRDF